MARALTSLFVVDSMGICDFSPWYLRLGSVQLLNFLKT